MRARAPQSGRVLAVAESQLAIRSVPPELRSESETGRYIGQLGDKVEGRRFVELLGSQDDHVWRMFEEELVSHDKELLLGDEPLQGAEDLKK